MFLLKARILTDFCPGHQLLLFEVGGVAASGAGKSGAFIYLQSMSILVAILKVFFANVELLEPRGLCFAGHEHLLLDVGSEHLHQNSADFDA